ncbi:MAG: cation diffusion facilitator family transporter [Candidatus Diapherotrites archaeon]|nr:cation diffusion facilitator family transporter [Candidatus Diapherotrites archaeon]
MNRLEKGQNASAVTAGITLLRAALQGAAGFLTGSTALLTLAVESLSDVFTSASSWFGLKIAQRKPDEKFPYGYYKAESLTSLVISLFILYAAFHFFFEGYERLFSPMEITSVGIGAAAALVSIVVSFALHNYLKKIAGETNSLAVKANADDKLNDVFSSSLVLVAVFSGAVGLPWLEGAVTLLVALLVLRTGLENARDSLFALMDVSPDKRVERRIRGVISSFKEVKHLKHLKLRKAGPFVLGEVEVEVAGSIDVKRAHAVTEKIQKKAAAQVPSLESFIIHVEPHKKDTLVLAIPLAEKKGVKSRVLGHVGRAKHFALVKISKGKALSPIIVENPYWDEKSMTGLRAANLIADRGADAVVVKNIGEIAFHTLRDKFVEIYRTRGNTAEEVVKLFTEGKLELLTEPTKKAGRARK